ncbi:MAG: DUF4010 domain-containing protein [Theionarchaea archaeon]|nr:DUF4010 domain-containing protein [Theionarchaea archaeon]
MVFISGIGFVSYFLMKIFGAKGGTGLTGILGGLVSSTAVTVTMSNRSKKSCDILYPALLATTIANSIMFLRILVEVFAVRRMLISDLLAPMICMMANVDAITLSMATLAGTEVTPEVAVDAIVLAAVSNVVTKTGIAVFFGSTEFRKYMILTSAAVMVVGLLIIVVI